MTPPSPFGGGKESVMKIKRIVAQNRRDFVAVYECEYCGHEREGTGYDDSYFHRVVVAEMKCPACDRAAPSDYRPLGTKYPAGQVV